MAEIDTRCAEQPTEMDWAGDTDYTSPQGLHVGCHYCGGRHVAEYHHEGRYGEGHIYAVVCTDPVANRLGVIDYYTTEALV
jgi:hypothetical protein